MHYNINNYLIKSENAAKSVKQPNKEIIKIIDSIPPSINVLDYGCGRLRYTIPLAEKVSNVVAIDSSEQVNKIQTINGIKTTIKKYGNKHLDNVSIFSIEDTKWQEQKYNFILCCNVLSAIPIYEERINIFRRIKELLGDEGRALVSTQYRNSYYNKYKKRNDCRKYYDGWIIQGKNDTAFYGLITLEKMIYYAKRANLKIDKSYKKEGSAYLILKK